MKYNAILWSIFTGRMKKGLREYYTKAEIKTFYKKATPIYKDLLSKVKGISDKNPMAFNIITSFIIIAIWLASERKITPERMSEVIKKAMDFKPLKLYYGMIDMNTKKGVRTLENMMKKNAAWAKNHPEDINTWDFHFNPELHKDGFYYHFTHCPIADFCREYGYEEINPVLCDIDYLTFGMIHSVLYREHTVAEGGGICDYWIVGDKVKNPS